MVSPRSQTEQAKPTLHQVRCPHCKINYEQPLFSYSVYPTRGSWYLLSRSTSAVPEPWAILRQVSVSVDARRGGAAAQTAATGSAQRGVRTARAHLLVSSSSAAIVLRLPRSSSAARHSDGGGQGTRLRMMIDHDD
eukprot:3454964-Rhodomonas_salina.2